MVFVGGKQGFDVVQLQAGQGDGIDFDLGLNCRRTGTAEESGISLAGMCLQVVPVRGEREFAEGDARFEARLLLRFGGISNGQCGGLTVE